ncbi:hypothetical protein QQF64_026335 [Cirrhinus molitorella]|uniref:Secreted protein n=1 Tax=Cirrhinus molitorella TaxID=172907 RepID=A0ABR3N964_9TELE
MGCVTGDIHPSRLYALLIGLHVLTCVSKTHVGIIIIFMRCCTCDCQQVPPMRLLIRDARPNRCVTAGRVVTQSRGNVLDVLWRFSTNPCATARRSGSILSILSAELLYLLVTPAEEQCFTAVLHSRDSGAPAVHVKICMRIVKQLDRGFICIYAFSMLRAIIRRVYSQRFILILIRWHQHQTRSSSFRGIKARMEMKEGCIA